MKVARGDVVLVDYPFSDRTGSKVRPCLVLQNDRDNARLDDTILALITSNTQRATSEPTQMLIDVATPEGKQTGLLFTSALQGNNIVTLDGQFIRRRVGTFPAVLMQQAVACIKAALEIV
jgi:mRNA interferase MazF